MDARRETTAADGRVLETCCYAEVGCEECLSMEDFEQDMRDPRSHFTLPCATLREARFIATLLARKISLPFRRLFAV